MTNKVDGNEISTKRIEEALRTANQGDVVRTNKRVRLTDEEKEARVEAKRIESESKKIARDLKREGRAKEKAEKKAHMTKVNKAAERLPTLCERGKELLDDTFASMEEGDVSAFIAHVMHQLRVRSTQASTGIELVIDQIVRIRSGAPAFLNQLAKVIKVQRIRCYVQPMGTDKKVYLFNTDVVPVTEAETLTDDAPTDNVRSIRATG